MSEIISQQALMQLVDAWLGQGKRVIAPCEVKPGLVLFIPVQSSSQIRLDARVRPGNTAKEAVFPRHEKLYGYRCESKQIELIDAVLPETQQIVLGARPCDALAFALLDPVFNWDFKDEFYNHRRKMTTVVTLACQACDEHCFCTSVGSSPADTRGSDAVLVELEEGRYEVRCVSDKGNMLFCGRTEHSDREGTIFAGPEAKLDLEAVERYLADHFEGPQWPAASMRCMGCGACAYNCPTCHCFDIVDEGNSSGGVRARNWDACQFPMFTLHASGHNPRNVQGQRQRQRVLHKFRIYREKFGMTLCTGCGNCTRNCPVGLGVRPVLETLERCAAAPAAESR